ncbi:MAG: glutathione S-transferase [Rhodopseudomonas sp.]|nr:glutathione S-transferase [Rhodopseudomonas sp.]
MIATNERFVLRSTLTSPFGRKARMAIDILGLTGRIDVVPANTLDDHDTLREQNPLGKMPCLLLADGTPIFDSGVIIEFLQEVAGRAPLVPTSGLARYKALTQARLADGIAEAALLMVYEGRFREPSQYSQRWLDHQRGKVTRGLAAFEREPPATTPTDIVGIGLACALGYLDWRKPVSWRDNYPRVAEWLAAFSKCEPAFARTEAPAA